MQNLQGSTPKDLFFERLAKAEMVYQEHSSLLSSTPVPIHIGMDFADYREALVKDGSAIPPANPDSCEASSWCPCLALVNTISGERLEGQAMSMEACV